ncbi:MAG: CotH kinase family protein [Clostridiales bacterium]|nr:CotH kinase family protein [Clostridiales bacterium]
MRSRFSKNLLTFLLITVCLCALFIAVGCNEKNPPIDKTEHTITFDTGVDGLTVPPIVSKAGEPITEPKPQREGYRFGGWTLDGKPYAFGTMPDKDLTLVATWIKLYSVTFITGTDDVIPTAWYAPGETVQKPQLIREGHTLVAWMLDGKPYNFGTMPNENITLTAVWDALVTIVFDTGTADFTVEPIVGVAGAEISAPVVNRRGYYLEYWMLNGIRYEFSVMPEESITLVAKWRELTNLPAMFIDLADKNNNPVPISSVTRETAVSSTITLTNTDDKYLLDSLKAEFKGRGHGSWNEAKKSYKIKFDKKQSLFGREKNKHWVIIACANFDDVTMSRNYLAYNMANEVFDGIEYATPAYWIEVYVNGEYHGVYLLCEHVRVSEGRLDIESKYGVEDTGYLVEYDAYATGEEGVDYFRVDGVKYGFTVHSPDPEDYATDGNITKAEYMKQVAYIKDYVSRVYKAAYSRDYTTFSELVDTDSFVDMYILHELFKNVDTGYSSFYLYKKPGGKLYAGPVWDFDGTTNTAYDRGDRSPSGIYVGAEGQDPYPYASELYIELYKTSGFRNAVRARWKVLSPNIRAFLDERLNDNVYEENKVAMGKNFVKWKNKSQATAETDWVNDVKTLKQWLMYRITWLDSTW